MKDGLRGDCRACTGKRYKAYYDANPEKVRNSQLVKAYGITLEQYDNIYVSQNGLCAICGKPETAKSKKYLAVDHDHEAGAIRALLCHKCNAGLGHFDDDPELLTLAREYLLGSGRCNIERIPQPVEGQR